MRKLEELSLLEELHGNLVRELLLHLIVLHVLQLETCIAITTLSSFLTRNT